MYHTVGEGKAKEIKSIGEETREQKSYIPIMLSVAET